MVYEIPQQLQYEEKIIFGLTFRQLVYASIFGIPAIAVIFKTDFDMVTKACIASVFMGIASLFMFFNFSSYIKNMGYCLRFRQVGIMDPKMISFIGIDKIEGGVVYVSKDKKPRRKR